MIQSVALGAQVAYNGLTYLVIDFEVWKYGCAYVLLLPGTSHMIKLFPSALETV